MYEVYDLFTGDVVTDLLTERAAIEWIEEECEQMDWDAFDFYGVRKAK